MTRRDIIIIATLVNAGLLAALFMLAVNTDDDKVSDPLAFNQEVVESKPTTTVSAPEPQEVEILSMAPTPIPAQPSKTNVVTNDEVDNALKEFASAPAAQTVVIEEDANQFIDAEEDAPEAPAPAPVVTAAPTPTQKSDNKKYVEVTIKRGDSLDKIARANNTTVAAIKEANQLKNDRLKIGKTLRIPVSSDKKVAVAKSEPIAVAPKAPVAQSDVQYYTVKSGDNPWKIAKQFNIKVDELLKLNNLNEEKARNLKVGDKLRVK